MCLENLKYSHSSRGGGSRGMNIVAGPISVLFKQLFVVGVSSWLQTYLPSPEGMHNDTFLCEHITNTLVDRGTREYLKQQSRLWVESVHSRKDSNNRVQCFELRNIAGVLYPRLKISDHRPCSVIRTAYLDENRDAENNIAFVRNPTCQKVGGCRDDWLWIIYREDGSARQLQTNQLVQCCWVNR
jgi:hypothetical protein